MVSGGRLELELIVGAGAVHRDPVALLAEQVGQAEIDVDIGPADLQVVGLVGQHVSIDATIAVGGRCDDRRRIVEVLVVERQLHAAVAHLEVCLQRERALTTRVEVIPDVAGREVQMIPFHEGDHSQGVGDDETGRILIVGDLARQRIAVLVQCRPGIAQDTWSENQRIGARRRLGRKRDFQTLWTQPVEARGDDGSLGTNEAEHVIGRSEG